MTKKLRSERCTWDTRLYESGTEERPDLMPKMERERKRVEAEKGARETSCRSILVPDLGKEAWIGQESATTVTSEPPLFCEYTRSWNKTSVAEHFQEWRRSVPDFGHEGRDVWKTTMDAPSLTFFPLSALSPRRLLGKYGPHRGNLVGATTSSDPSLPFASAG